MEIEKAKYIESLKNQIETLIKDAKDKDYAFEKVN